MSGTTATQHRELRLEDRYEGTGSRVFLTGMQAMVRAILDQARDDRATGKDVRSFVSGYPGSPLGGFEDAVRGAGELLAERRIVLQPSVNEELAATAVLGATKRDVYGDPGAVDGVTGIWYGKCNGVDRCVDAFKYGNYGGLGGHDAVVVLAGDDPNVKSSGIPGESEYTLAAAGIPVLYPSSISEMYSFMRHAIAASRLTGCWVALKLTTDLCDGGATLHLPERFTPVIPDLPDGFEKFDTTFYFGQPILDGEESLFGPRHEAFRRYVRTNDLDTVRGGAERTSRGIIVAGKTSSDTRQALRDRGILDEALSDHGVRTLELGAIYPIEPSLVRDFARGLDEILVIEEKRDFVEQQVARILYGTSDAPTLVGKSDGEGRPLVPLRGELDAADVSAVLERWAPSIGSATPSTPAHSRAALPELPRALNRTPNYCSGCPHSRATVSPGNDTVMGGIGCHSIGLFLSQQERRYTMNVQMGGEGAPFVGAAPFVGTGHVIQNLGDGTYFHSGSLAVRWCVAAGVNITFRLLYNGHISMTGGQQIPGVTSVAALSRELDAMGVRRTVIATEAPDAYRTEDLAENTTVIDRDSMTDAVAELSQEPGVTFLIHDGECALEKRRRWRRGTTRPPKERLFIHPDICDGCGDCGERSNCPSVQPTDTELGRKTRIEQSSCSVDRACVQGDCPSFIGVSLPDGALPERRPPVIADRDLPEPQLADLTQPYRILMVGIGGTGVVTANAILAHAALMEDRAAVTLDQTGLAQKGGPVSSHLIVAATDGALASNKIGPGQADLYLGLDPMEAVKDDHLHRTSNRTSAVVNTSITPTVGMITDVAAPTPDVPLWARTIVAATNPDRGRLVPAGEMADKLFADHMKTNLIALGAASQAGLLPVAAVTVESAIRLNGVDVEANLLAFRYGRLWVVDPEHVTGLMDYRTINTPNSAPATELPPSLAVLPEDLKVFVVQRHDDLVSYQSPRYARRYIDVLATVAERESALPGDRTRLTETVARQLFKLMAYKDEYEVARLILEPRWRSEVSETFGADAGPVVYYLHPPLLRALGLKRKLRLGQWAHPIFRLLRAMRHLRGTPLDPFGYAKLRKLERELPEWYVGTIKKILTHLEAANHDELVTIANATDTIRGFEDLKLRNIERARTTVDSMLQQLATSSSGSARTGKPPPSAPAGGSR